MIYFLQIATPNRFAQSSFHDPGRIVQGSSIKTWTFDRTQGLNRVLLDCSTNGRPLEGLVELWQGPDNKPAKIRVYSEDGRNRPLRALIELPSTQNTLAVRNIGNLEFPLSTSVADYDSVEISHSKPLDPAQVDNTYSCAQIQGGAIKTYKFGEETVSLQIVLKTYGLPL